CLDGLRALCDEHGLLLIFDEVQTGVGRTGHLFAHQRSTITPDIMPIAKAIGGGFPLGAILTTAEVGNAMTAGTHGSTFGGNPLAVAVGQAVLDIVADEAFLAGVRDASAHFNQSLLALKDTFPDLVDDVRGEGLLVGMRFKCPMSDVVDAAFAEKLLLVGAGDNVVRLLPPLNTTPAERSQAIERLSAALSQIQKTTLAQPIDESEAPEEGRRHARADGVERRT
ncbi:MAG: aminotransferase class III-fold pyridoxal phosphate-dependent enzyme, partial [Pseudomonadota bacterium]